MSPTTPTVDYYMVIPLRDSPAEAGVMLAHQVFVATGATEEDAVAKVAKIDSGAKLFTAQVVPTFPPPA
jgi:hypothetical protein